jgi:IS1 family transposase
MNPDTHRQQLLFVWTEDSRLDSRVVGWSFFDGTDATAAMDDAPATLAVELLTDGWRLLQAAPLTTRRAGDEFAHGVLEFEWLFERLVERTEP